MKNFLILGAILSSLSFSGCGSSSSSSGGGQPAPHPNSAAGMPADFAATPQPCNNQNQNGFPQSAQCQHYNNWYSGWNPNQIQWYYGAWYWPQYGQVTGYNCGCPNGFYPVSGQTFGIACAPVQYFNSSTLYWNSGWNQNHYQYQYWNYPQNGGYINIPQNHYQGSTQQGLCNQNSTAQGCDVRLNTCPSGSSCQPVGGGSTIGLCVR